MLNILWEVTNLHFLSGFKKKEKLWDSQWKLLLICCAKLVNLIAKKAQFGKLPTPKTKNLNIPSCDVLPTIFMGSYELTLEIRNHFYTNLYHKYAEFLCLKEKVMKSNTYFRMHYKL